MITNKIKYLNDKTELFAFFAVFVLITFLMTLGVFGYVASLLFAIIILFSIFLKIKSDSELTTIILLPIMLSVFQNVYLGIFSPYLSDVVIKLLTVVNFLISCFILFLLIILVDKNKKENKFMKILFLCLIVYSLFSTIFLDSFNIISIISSLRNVVSIFIFYFIGNISHERVDIKKFNKILIIFGIIVILIGFYELFIDKFMWKHLNITELWTKKGLHLQYNGWPANFYSSEKINGERIRRMTSTFADPVNLGTFLFAVFCLTWFYRSKIGIALTLIAIALTVSKGAFLGLLIFICIYTLVYHVKKLKYILPTMGVIGIVFLIYAYLTSANSVFLHISGLFSSFSSIITKPFGYGLGSVGVLSEQFSGVSANSNITETGLGMIIGQLGIIGLVIYVLFFVYIIISCFKLENKKQRVLCLTLVLSIFANIAFNEVALSPNSCGIYFLVIGFYLKYLNTGYTKKQDIVGDKI